MRPRRLIPLALLLFVGLAVFPSLASAQATRTWVSGVGDDVNPCSRTAPCKTFAGAISKTAAGGEIDVLDPGGFGIVTINKSITIDGNGTFASITDAGSSGITINTNNANDKVILRDFRINGTRRATTAGINGVRIIKAGLVLIDNMRLFGHSGAGVVIEGNNAPFTRAIIRNTSIHDNGTGVLIRPGASGVNRATIRGTDVDDNGNGVYLDSASGGTAVAHIINSAMTDSGLDPAVAGTGYGLLSSGAKSTARITGNEIQANYVGLGVSAGGQILSAGDNSVFGNLVDGNPTGTFTKK